MGKERPNAKRRRLRAEHKERLSARVAAVTGTTMDEINAIMRARFEGDPRLSECWERPAILLGMVTDDPR